MAGVVIGTAYADLSRMSATYKVKGEGRACRTVEVMSDEHTSQTYLVPPSVPRVPVFFLMTPMVPRY